MKVALLLGISLAVTESAHAEDRVPEHRAAAPVFEPAYPRGVDPAIAAREPVKPVTNIEEAITFAYATNPTLLGQRSLLKSTDALYPAARAAYGPQVSVEGRYTFARDRFQQNSGVYLGAEGWTATASLIVNQPLFSFGRRHAAESSALARIAFDRSQLRLTEADTMLTVIRDYVSVIRDRAALAIARENLSLLERQYTDSDQRFKVREITSTDLQQVQTRVEFGRAQVLSAQGQLGSSQSRFLQNIGALPGELTEPTPLDLGVATLDEAYGVAETNSALIKAAQAREKVSRAELEAARSDRLPEVGLQGTGALGTVTDYTNRQRTTEIRSSVVVSMPLIDSGLRRARIEQARQANDSDWRLIDAAVRDTHQRVAESWDAYRSTLLSLDHYREAAAAAQKAYDGAVVQEKAGARTTLDVLDLARDLLNVRTNYVAAQAAEYIARATLLSAMGNLEAPELVPSVTPYDPEANFKRQKNRGDIPLLTPILSGLDSLGTARDLKSDRPIRDVAGPLKTNSAVTSASSTPPPPAP